jgi:hypothetical protein
VQETKAQPATTQAIGNFFMFFHPFKTLLQSNKYVPDKPVFVEFFEPVYQKTVF